MARSDAEERSVQVLEATARIVQFLFRIKRTGSVTLVRKTLFGSEKVHSLDLKQRP